MKIIKLRSVEILTNGCVSFSYANSGKLQQSKFNEKDSFYLTQKYTKTFKEKLPNKIYKSKFFKNKGNSLKKDNVY